MSIRLLLIHGRFSIFLEFPGALACRQAQLVFLPRTTVTASAPIATLKGLTIHPQTLCQFDFIVEPARAGLGRAQLKDESLKMIKYFLASLTMPRGDVGQSFAY